MVVRLSLKGPGVPSCAFGAARRGGCSAAQSPCKSGAKPTGKLSLTAHIVAEPYPLPPDTGEFVVVNQHLLHDLTRLSLWDSDMKNEIVAANGSVQVCGWVVGQGALQAEATGRGLRRNVPAALILLPSSPFLPVLCSVHLGQACLPLPCPPAFLS